MFNEIFKFEILSWLRKPMIYIFFAINFLMIFLTVTIENVSIGEGLDNININAPYAIIYYVAFMSLLSILMITAIMNHSALKDYENNFHSILFSTSIDKKSYLLGRFFSSILISLFVFLGVYLGLVIGTIFSNSDSLSVGAFNLAPYINSFIFYLLPNTFLIGAIIFALASLFRSVTASFVGAVVILIGYLMAGVFVSNLDNEYLAIILDPLGIHSLSIITKYWTVSDKNTMVIPLDSGLMINRIVWTIVAFIVFGISYFRIKMNSNLKARKRKNELASFETEDAFKKLNVLPKVNTYDNFNTSLLQFWHQIKIEFISTVKSPAFKVIMLFAILNSCNAIMQSDIRFGSGNYPVTFLVLEAISNSLYIFIIVIITYYSGLMIWTERQLKMNEIIDSSPFHTTMPLFAKYFALLGVVCLFLIMSIACGILIQLLKGYYHFELSLYFKQLFLIDGIKFAIMIAVAMLVHVLVNNLYLGFFVFIVLLLFNSFGWSGLGLDSNLLAIGSLPSFKYSDITKFVPFERGLSWYSFYWLLFAALALCLSILFWVRGKSLLLRDRIRIAKLRFSKNMAFAFIGLLSVWMLTGSFLYYNAEILNENLSDNEEELQAVAFEMNYKKYAKLPQPRIIALDYTIDIFPNSRTVLAEIDVTVENKNENAVAQIHFTCPSLFDVNVNIENATLFSKDTILGYYIYNLGTELLPGESLSFKVFSEYKPNGIENELSIKRITQNASFIDAKSILPIVGYGKYKELSDNDIRKKHGLTKVERMHELSHTCSLGCSNSYLSSDSDWIELSCTISTSHDQIAIAPGNLKRNWQENGRNFYRYEMENPVINFYSFLSGKFEIKREKWNDVDLEVYYHKGHEYNVDNMLLSMRKSLDYFDKTFSPYPFKQARIIEFPRHSSFAQAFPGTMPYAESMGFLTDVEKENSIDRGFHTVAHEMAHQWWGHQVVPANTQGGTMLSESFAQYSALMVMEEAYGKELMQKFLKYEMDAYLRSRGRETSKELPLFKVEDQGYIHYRKGSVVMYALSQYIGVEALNKALRNFMSNTAYSEPPYPTSLDFLNEVYAVTPDSLQYIVKDLFEKIVIFSNKVTSGDYIQLPNGRYEVMIKFDVEKFEANEKGKEVSVPLNDHIYFGIYKTEGDAKKLIYYQPHRITSKSNTLKFIVDEEPSEIGVDPIHLLIDKIPDDNLFEF